MKAELIGRKNNTGMSTLEILIAFAILILCISAVIMVVFGNQSVAVDSQVTIEATSKAQAALETARVNSLSDFNQINPILPHSSPGSIYTESLDVAQTDLYTKEVTATVSWQLAGRNLSTALTTLLTNRNVSDTCSSVLTGDWTNPKIESVFDFAFISPSSTYTLTDIDAYNGKLYVTAGKTTNINDPTFFVFDISDPNNPLLIQKIDNDPTVKTGVNALSVDTQYAYLANSLGPSKGQLQIIDLLQNPPQLITTYKVPSVTGSSSQAIGSSIFYQNNEVYLGLTKTLAGPEFSIIDVADPFHAFLKGQYPIGNAINSIMVRNNYAYIASPNSQELQILDVTNLNNPVFAGGFNSLSGAGNGKSIYLVGNKIYLGKTTGASFDFHILKNASNPTELGGKDVASSINGVVVKDYLSFLLTGTASTGSKLQIFRTDNPQNIMPWNSSPLAISSTGNAVEPSIDCEGDRLYISSNNSSDQGSIYVIKSSP